MRIYFCGVLVLAMMPMAASAQDLVGGGLKVASVERVDDSKAVIRLGNGKGGVESLWVDCLAAEWGYEGVEAGALVEQGQKSQAIAYRACRDLPSKASLLQAPGTWRAAGPLK